MKVESSRTRRESDELIKVVCICVVSGVLWLEMELPRGLGGRRVGLGV